VQCLIPCLDNLSTAPSVLLRFWSPPWGILNERGETEPLQIKVQIGCGTISKFVDKMEFIQLIYSTSFFFFF
jgi:hypothetical protein